MKIMKRRGPNIDPCGTPETIVALFDKLDLTAVLCDLLVRYEVNHLIAISSRPYILSFSIKILWLFNLLSVC